MDDQHDSVSEGTAGRTEPQWRPLSAVERRVLGVLVEKAKTTPENYPLSLNAIRVGANQKSNRAPQMELDEDRVTDALDSLRQVGAVVEIQSDGRVSKYRHLAYAWLGVDKVELAVMAELLLRGDQTIGELRGRAARMEPIADLGALRPVLSSLEAKRLIVYLTPSGRGSVVTHTLYKPDELNRLRGQYAQSSAAPAESDASAPPRTRTSPADTDLRSEMESLRQEVELLRQELAELRAALGDDSTG